MLLFERQEYQEHCVNNIINVLNKYDFKTNDANSLNNNLKTFYQNENIPLKNTVLKPKLDILMETGTGKTFTYLKTIFDINKNYNINKFVIFVPRKAIKEGVIQNIQLTSNYFYQVYGKRLVKYTYENEKSISNIKNHYLKNIDELSVLVLTNSSIDRDVNVLKRNDDSLFKERSVLESIININPVIIIDEPHLLKGEKFTNTFDDFKSLSIRFGATFPLEKEHSLSNMVYTLDSASAFKNHLVKKICVHTNITSSNSLKVSKSSKSKVTLLYFKDAEEKEIELTKGDDIGIKTGLSEYNGVQIVNSNSKSVFLSNKKELIIDSNYELDENEIRMMVKKTIQLHFEKEERLFNNNVKTLSLFFIPNKPDYRGDNPKIRNIFEQEYRSVRNEIIKTTKNREYIKYLEQDFDENGNLTVCEGYFSGDTGSSEEKIAKGVETILKDKEELLSLKCPLRFIFSIWALQEGWDNPNIFNLCKLSNTTKEISRRQQIGRGLRICVNNQGKRLTYNYFDEDEARFYEFNTLDVIVSGHEKKFIEEIQKEIGENSYSLSSDLIDFETFKPLNLNDREINKTISCLEDNKVIEFNEDLNKYEIKSSVYEFLIKSLDKISFMDKEKQETLLNFFKEDNSNNKPVENGNKKKETVKLKKANLDEFKELWETINRKSKIVYEDINEEALINEISRKFNNEPIYPIKITYEKKEINPLTNEIIKKNEEVIGCEEFFKNNDYKGFITSIINENNTIPLHFLIKIFNKIDINKIKTNPNKSKEVLIDIIKKEIHNHIIQKVSYDFENEIKINSLRDSNGNYKDEINTNLIGRYVGGISPNNFLYEKVIYDSEIEKEAIENEFEKIDDKSITVYAKLPKISIPTPFKSYNPDFAYLIKSNNNKTLFLIVETKGYNQHSDIPEIERQKISYAEKFFKKLQEQVPKDIDIIFKKRINKESLTDILKDINND